MTDGSDETIGTDAQARALDAALDHLVAGGDPAPDAPAWCADVAVLVQAAGSPAEGDELAAEHDIVARMAEIRRAVLDGGATREPGAAPAATAPVGPGDDDTAETAAALTVTALDAAVTAEAGAGVTDLATYRSGPGPARGGGEDDDAYRPRHVATAGADPGHPAAATIGRLVAMKAAAATTAVALGVAAAAATTGIVATVVVPALRSEPPVRDPAPTTTGVDPSTTTRRTEPDEAPAGSAPATCADETPCDAAGGDTTDPVEVTTTVPATASTTVAPGGEATDPATATTIESPTTSVEDPPTTTSAPEPTTTVPPVPGRPPIDPPGRDKATARN